MTVLIPIDHTARGNLIDRLFLRCYRKGGCITARSHCLHAFRTPGVFIKSFLVVDVHAHVFMFFTDHDGGVLGPALQDGWMRDGPTPLTLLTSAMGGSLGTIELFLLTSVRSSPFSCAARVGMVKRRVAGSLPFVHLWRFFASNPALFLMLSFSSSLSSLLATLQRMRWFGDRIWCPPMTAERPCLGMSLLRHAHVRRCKKSTQKDLANARKR